MGLLAEDRTDYNSASDDDYERWLRGENVSRSNRWRHNNPAPHTPPTGHHVEHYTGNRAKVAGRLRLEPEGDAALQRQIDKQLRVFDNQPTAEPRTPRSAAMKARLGHT